MCPDCLRTGAHWPACEKAPKPKADPIAVLDGRITSHWTLHGARWGEPDRHGMSLAFKGGPHIDLPISPEQRERLTRLAYAWRGPGRVRITIELEGDDDAP